VNTKRAGAWGGLTRGEQIALTLRLSVMVILAGALVRALMAFWNLQQGRDIPFQHTFYIPGALVAGLALTVLSIWRAIRAVYAGNKSEEPPRDEERP